MVRIPVFIGLAIVPRGHAPVTHQDQGFRNGPRGSVPGPWLIRAPENRRYPIVSNALTVVRERNDGRTDSWLAVVQTAPRPFWLTTEAYPPAMPMPPSALPCPLAFRRGKAKVIPSNSAARFMLWRSGGGGPIRNRGSKPNPLPGSPPPSSINHHLIQRLWSYRTPRPP